MKKTTRRILAFLAAAAMAMSLTACSGGGGQDADVVQGEIPEGKLFAPGTEIDMVICSHASWPYNENWPLWKYFEEASGATFNISAIPSSDFGTKLPLMMANPEELPDMMHTWAKDQVDPYATTGAYLAFDDYADQMPNYTAFLNSFDELARADLLNQCKSGDGKVYRAPSYGTHRVTNMRTWMYRKDIFEKHGLKAPETYDELYEVAKQLKELYPESYPICFRSGMIKFEDTTPAWKNDFSYMHYYDYDAGEWKFGSRDPILKEIIVYYKKLVDEKLVPPDFLTMETKSWEELMSTDRGFITNDYVVRVDFFNVPNRQENPEYTLEVIAPPVPNVETGSAKIAKTNLDFSGWTVLNKGNEQRAANCFKLIDWMYTDEAIELLSWGKEGETFEVADGKKKYILADGEEAKQKYGVGTNGLYQNIDQDAFESSYTEENIESCVKALGYIEEQSNPILWLALDPDEESRAGAILDDLRPYCEEQISKFLLGQTPMSEWDTFVAGLDDMGVDELLKIYTDAYNRVVGK